MSALRSLYGEDRHKIPFKVWVRAGLVGYAVMGLVPAGRTVAESTRAALLAKYTSGVEATVAAARMQAVVLLGNAAISLFAAWAIFYVMGFSLPLWLILANLAVTFVLGLGILLVGKNSRIGAWIGGKIHAVRGSGSEFDKNFSEKNLIPLRALAFEFLGRVIQVIQNGIMVFAVGGKLGVIPALGSEAIHLVGAAVGDLFPAQLGFTEANYQLSARALSLAPADALSIALLAHLTQIFWIAVGLGVTAFWSAGRQAQRSRRLQQV